VHLIDSYFQLFFWFSGHTGLIAVSSYHFTSLLKLLFDFCYRLFSHLFFFFSHFGRYDQILTHFFSNNFNALVGCNPSFNHFGFSIMCDTPKPLLPSQILELWTVVCHPSSPAFSIFPYTCPITSFILIVVRFLLCPPLKWNDLFVLLVTTLVDSHWQDIMSPSCTWLKHVTEHSYFF